MKVLIASSKNEATQQLQTKLTAVTSDLTFIRAGTADQAIEELTRQQVDIALVDIHLLASSPAAMYILRLAHPEGVLSALLREQTTSGPGCPGVLLTFDGLQLGSTLEALMERLESAANDSVRALAARQGVNLWAQRTSGDWESVNSSFIAWAVAEQGRVEAHDRSGGVYLLRDRLKELEKRLDGADFCRIHKSYLVNLNHVLEVQPWSSGGFLLLMDDQARTRLPISRRFAGHLRERTGWTVGPVREPSAWPPSQNSMTG